MDPLEFKSKADTLKLLEDKIGSAKVLSALIYTVQSWEQDEDCILEDINKKFSGTPIIVRSSSTEEDSSNCSNAGAFESVANVSSSDKVALREAITKVVASYPVSDCHHSSQFFVQEFLTDLQMSGVLFTCDLDTNSPYYIINYDEQGSFDAVTSGGKANLKTFVRFKGSTLPFPNSEMESLAILAEELEVLFANDRLDIEFAITKSGELYLLQVRPLVGEGRSRVDSKLLALCLVKVRKKISKLNSSHPGLLGDRGMYSVMTDWNPAEIIGVRPRKLALSLYQELITDSTWAFQRDNYGYRRLRSFPLLVSFLNRPYVDTRVSFNSFVPKSLPDELAAKLVNYYLECLEDIPSDHDKVEFNIIFSCYDLSIHDRIRKLRDSGFNELEVDRIKYSLLQLTNSIISAKNGLYLQDLERVEKLESRFQDVIQHDMSLIDKIYWLIQDCKRYGTLPFAGLARAGFIAVQMLRSFVDQDILTTEEFHEFMNSLNTVAKQLSTDTGLYMSGELSKDRLLAKYGHLRPGTYDILSPRYDEAFEQYFGNAGSILKKGENVSKEFFFTDEQISKIDFQLEQNGIESSAVELIEFIIKAIEGREYSKFLFTRSLSHILVLIERLGERQSLTKDEMSFINIQCVLAQYANLEYEDLRDIFLRDINANKKAYEMAQHVMLPQLISCVDQVEQFYMSDVEPNFVTREKITNAIVFEEELAFANLSGKIVFIRSADPGYDWIFSRNISGLVTMYGGANSHMAIRCAELQIPAVIGCGERNFEAWSKSKLLELDCNNKRVTQVS